MAIKKKVDDGTFFLCVFVQTRRGDESETVAGIRPKTIIKLLDHNHSHIKTPTTFLS